jgi:hypothetical protein
MPCQTKIKKERECYLKKNKIKKKIKRKRKRSCELPNYPQWPLRG